MANSTSYASRNVTFEDFDPNKQFSDKPLYGFFDGHKFRTYANRGHMLNAVHASPRAKCYVQTPAGWQLIATKTVTTDKDECELCRVNIKDSYNDYWTWQSKSWLFRRDQYGKIADPLELLHVCKDCRDCL